MSNNSSEETITLPLDVVKEWRRATGITPFFKADEPLAAAIDAALWTPPVSHVEWIDCAEHPVPILRDIPRGMCLVRHDITHWALITLPEVDK